jgi:putative Ca2+/H+ antiporter (TMEM165/GDT1 family)
MKDRNKGYLWFIPLTVAVVPGIALAARNDDPLAVAAGTVAALAVGIVLVVVAKWLLGRKAE